MYNRMVGVNSCVWSGMWGTHRASRGRVDAGRLQGRLSWPLEQVVAARLEYGRLAVCDLQQRNVGLAVMVGISSFLSK